MSARCAAFVAYPQCLLDRNLLARFQGVLQGLVVTRNDLRRVDAALQNITDECKFRQSE